MKTLKQFDLGMLNLAFDQAKKSPANKRKVGTVIVDMSTESVIASGYNKMFENLWQASCENEDGESYECVMHAEESAIIQLLHNKNFTETFSKRRKVLYATYSPCMNCCKLIAHE